MDRIALSNRIKGLSEVFASDNEIAQDLGAMAYVLANMSEEKFASIVNPGIDNGEKEAAGIPFSMSPAKQPSVVAPEVGKLNDNLKDEVLGKMIEMLNSGMNPSQIKSEVKKMAPALMSGEPTPNKVPTMVQASEDSECEMVGMYWNKAASNAVADALLKDVVGMDKSICCDTKRHLDKEQMPDSEKKQETPSTLKGEQIPVNKENLDSGIVEKAKAAKPVNKQAGSEEGPGKPDGTGPCKDTTECPNSDKAAVEESVEDTGKSSAEDSDKDASLTEEASVQSEGVELTAPMSDAKCSSDEEAELNKLFD
jgi:hypothetical protein